MTTEIIEPVDITIKWFQNDCVGQEEYTKKWYYYDETEQLNGPFDSEHEARIDLVLYCFFCLEGYSLDGNTIKQGRDKRDSNRSTIPLSLV